LVIFAKAGLQNYGGKTPSNILEEYPSNILSKELLQMFWREDPSKTESRNRIRSM